MAKYLEAEKSRIRKQIMYQDSPDLISLFKILLRRNKKKGPKMGKVSNELLAFGKEKAFVACSFI